MYNGSPVVLLVKPLLIQARPDKEGAIMKGKEKICSTPAKRRQAHHCMGQRRGSVGVRSKDAEQGAEIDHQVDRDGEPIGMSWSSRVAKACSGHHRQRHRAHRPGGEKMDRVGS